jgi:putative transposase
MFSYEDRIRAVKLYLKLGKRVAATIRQLGYPTKNTLKGWHREFLQSQDLRVHKQSVHRYSTEQKQVAIEHYKDHGRCISFTLKSLGYPGGTTFRKWLDELCPEARIRCVSRRKPTPRSKPLKRAAVMDFCLGEDSAKNIAQKLDVCRQTLYNWKDELLDKGASSNMTSEPQSTLLPDREALEKTIESLKKDVRKLQLEHDLLKKANELLKKDLGVNLQLLTNRDKALLVDALRSEYEVSELILALGIARSSYFYHRARLKLPDKYAEARCTMAELFEVNYRCYGYRRLRAALKQKALYLSEKVVRRLMKQECLYAATPKRRRYSSYFGEISPAPDNLVNRDFHASNPNEKWLTDITEFHIPAGKVYLSPMLDCFDGWVVSWTSDTSPSGDLVNTMLDEAIQTVSDSESEDKPIVHSDRGAHYRWPGWLKRMSDANFVRSMSRKACSPDNAACEGFFGRLKTEFFYARTWMDVTVEQFMQMLDSYIHWYNEKRIKMSLGSCSPLEYRARRGLVT